MRSTNSMFINFASFRMIEIAFKFIAVEKVKF